MNAFFHANGDIIDRDISSDGDDGFGCGIAEVNELAVVSNKGVGGHADLGLEVAVVNDCCYLFFVNSFNLLYSSTVFNEFLKWLSGSHEFSAVGQSFHLTRYLV